MIISGIFVCTSHKINYFKQSKLNKQVCWRSWKHLSSSTVTLVFMYSLPSIFLSRIFYFNISPKVCCLYDNFSNVISLHFWNWDKFHIQFQECWILLDCLYFKFGPYWSDLFLKKSIIFYTLDKCDNSLYVSSNIFFFFLTIDDRFTFMYSSKNFFGEISFLQNL